MKTVEGRVAITRTEWAQQAGLSGAWAKAAYEKRAENGHPETAFVIGRTSYWWQDELTAWWERHQEQMRPAPIERVGDPDELLFAQGVADLLGYSNPRTVLSMLARQREKVEVGAARRKREYFPEPDAVTTGEGQKSGQPRPQWKRSTVWDWADSRLYVHKKTAESEQDDGSEQRDD